MNEETPLPKCTCVPGWWYEGCPRHGTRATLSRPQPAGGDAPCATPNVVAADTDKARCAQSTASTLVASDAGATVQPLRDPAFSVPIAMKAYPAANNCTCLTDWRDRLCPIHGDTPIRPIPAQSSSDEALAREFAKGLQYPPEFHAAGTPEKKLLSLIQRVRAEGDKQRFALWKEWENELQKTRSQLAALKATVAGLEGDRERLDWLQSNGGQLTARAAERSMDDTGCFWEWEAWDIEVQGKTIREAIDAARAAQTNTAPSTEQATVASNQPQTSNPDAAERCTCGNGYDPDCPLHAPSPKADLRSKLSTLRTQLAEVEKERDEWHRTAASHLADTVKLTTGFNDELSTAQSERDKALARVGVLEGAMNAKYKVDPDLRIPTYQELYDYAREVWAAAGSKEFGTEYFNREGTRLFVHTINPERYA